MRFPYKTHYTGSRALVIGIDTYTEAPPLSYAVNDATEIARLLCEEMDFPKENVVLITNEEATKEKILHQYLHYSREDIDVDDRIVVFFAGHGHTKSGWRGEIGYLVPHDGNIFDVNTLIRWDDLTKNSELVRAKHLLFIMDACYGGLALTRQIQAGSTRFLKDMMMRYSRQVLTWIFA